MKRKILWIDDEADLISGLMYQVKKLGIGVDTCATYAEAINVIDRRDMFDAYLVDMIIPLGLQPDSKENNIQINTPGLDLVEKIRSLHQSAKIIVLTVLNNDELNNNLSKLNVTILRKPILPSSLKEILMDQINHA